MAPGAVVDDASESTKTVVDDASKGTNGIVEANGHSTNLPIRVAITVNGQSVGKEITIPTEAIPNANGANDDTETADKESTEENPESESSNGEKTDDGIMKCEIKHLDRRYDDKDEQYYVERKEEIEKPKQKDWWQLFAFCLVRKYDEDSEYESTHLYINPQPLRQLLFDVIGNYPSDPIDVEDTQIEAPYHSLFYYRKELEHDGKQRFVDDEESLSQLDMLLAWINNHFEADIAAYERCVNNDVKAISYDRMWTLFRPKTLVYNKMLNQHRAYKIRDHWYDNNGETPGLILRSSFIDFDGNQLGTRKIDLFVPMYNGTRELREISTLPLSMHEDKDKVTEELIERGRLFEQFIGQHYLQYDGIALKKAMCGYTRFNVNGRVMIDCKTYHRLDANDSFYVTEMVHDEAAKQEKARQRAAAGADFESENVVHDKLSEEDVILCNALVRGFSFTQKRFLEFYVDQLRPIEWNTKCFDSLVLDEGTKKTVQALVSMHSKKRDSFDDIVKGKGQGLVCVLHGPPGVGKTLTAECVAEYVQRPLFMVSSGDLGISSTDLDHELSEIMDMTSTWQAVLLIDEADVFLESRSLHDLHRNAMVSVFLRVLEYYTGILFLTTNRVNTFDDAFKSRIHIPIRYTDLSVESRRQIWTNFCAMVPGGVNIDEKGIATLAEHELNGRQIKNVIKAAESLAAFDNVKLDLKQLQQVTKIQAVFEKDLMNPRGVDYTAPGSTRKNADSERMYY